MKGVIVKFVVFLLIIISNLFANPAWYLNVAKTKPNSYIGYGSGVDEPHAKQEAFNDIVSQISVSVTTSLKQNQKVQNGEFKNTEEFKSFQTSDAVLSDYIILKSEFYDGKYFVAVEYENIPSFDKFVRKVNMYYGVGGTTSVVQKNLRSEANLNSEAEATPPKRGYLSCTLMAKKLKKYFKKDIDFELIRKDKKWYIKHRATLQALDKKDFSKFFTSVSNPKIEINTNKKRNILYDGDKFFFKVKSKKSGFVSILSVYEDGTVSTLVRNIPISKAKLENIPDEDFEMIPEAGLIQDGVETFDLYVAIYSKKKMRFDSFAYADEELIEEEKYKNFDELINFLDGKVYSTLKVVTKPK